MRSPCQWAALPLSAPPSVRIATPAKEISMPRNLGRVNGSKCIRQESARTMTGPSATMSPVCATEVRAKPLMKQIWLSVIPLNATSVRTSHSRPLRCNSGRPRHARNSAPKRMAAPARRNCANPIPPKTLTASFPATILEAQNTVPQNRRKCIKAWLWPWAWLAKLLLSQGHFFDSVEVGFISQPGRLGDVDGPLPGHDHFRVDDILRPIPLAGRNVSRKRESGQRGHGDIVGPPDS